MTQNNLKDPGPSLKNNGELWIATGRNRFDKNWKNKKLEWSEIIARLTEPRRTSETYAEYIRRTGRRRTRHSRTFRI